MALIEYVLQLNKMKLLSHENSILKNPALPYVYVI